jgi:uncharacterized membrane protein
VQCSYLPSRISLLADQEAVQWTSLTVFRTVHAYWETLDPMNRPQGCTSAGFRWGPTRLAYLQHDSDPIAFFSGTLAFHSPAWLQHGQRAPDISDRFTRAAVTRPSG